MSISVTEPGTDGRDLERELVQLLSRALRLAGQAGRPVAASRIAAKAWWTLRAVDANGAQRIDAVMHYLANLPDEVDASDPNHPTELEHLHG